MEAVGRVVPVLPVPLVAAALLEPGEALSEELDLHRRTQAIARRLLASGAHVYVPRDDEEYATTVGLRMLTLRRLVEDRDGRLVAAAGELPLLRYYANSIRHLLVDAEAAPTEIKQGVLPS